MSDTPRTDEAEFHERPQAAVRVLCRQLERELNAALKEIEELNAAAAAHMAVCGKEPK